MYFDLLKDHVVFRNLDRLLNPVSEAIRSASTSLDEDADSDPDWLDSRIDEETDVVEGLLGIAFVICQIHLTEVVSRIRALHALYKHDHPGQVLVTTTGSKQAILAFGSMPAMFSSYSQIATIDALANYFKHRDEWRGSWDKLTEPSKHTVSVIQAVGASQGSTGNLRAGAEALGNATYDSVIAFSDALRAWRSELTSAYSRELVSKGKLR